MDKEDVRYNWDRIARNYSETRDPSGPETELIADLLERFDDVPRVLDVGCGDGARTLRYLPENSVGIDISRRGLDIARSTVDQDIVQGDMQTLPFAPNSFDAITAYFSVFHVHRSNHPAVFEEFARVLRPEGKLLMTLPKGRYHQVREGWMGGRMLFSSMGAEKTLDALAAAGFSDLNTTESNDPLGGTTTFVIGSRR